jgi:hypothetical protein
MLEKLAAGVNPTVPPPRLTRISDEEVSFGDVRGPEDDLVHRRLPEVLDLEGPINKTIFSL